MRTKRTRVGLALLIGVLVGPVLFGADLARGKKLMQIGDYAAALAELAKADPTNAEARLLTARCFAQCTFILQMPGPVNVGRTNRDRALYQLGVLLKLGKEGERRFLEAISAGDKLSPIAVDCAGRNKIAAAAPAVAEVLGRKETTEKTARAAVTALEQIGGEHAANAIKKQMEQETDPRRKNWFRGKYVNCLGEEALLTLARTSKDPLLLRQLSAGYAGQRPIRVLLTLARRTDVEENVRSNIVSALGRNMAKTDPDGFRKLLDELVRDASETVRWAAIQQMARVAPDKAIEPLVAALADKKRAYLAVQRLVGAKSAAAIEPLMKVLEDKCHPKRHAAWRLSRDRVFSALLASGIRGDQLVQAVRLMLRPDPAVRRFGRPPRHRPELPFRLPKEELPHMIAELLKDPDKAVRHAAARGIGRMAEDDAIKTAIGLVNDKDDEIQRQAGNVILGRIRSGRLDADKLALLLKTKSRYVVQGAARLLAAKPAKDAVEPMLALLKDPNRAGYAMRELTGFFSAMPDPRAVAPLVAAILRERGTGQPEALAATLKKCAKDLPDAAMRVALGLASKSEPIRRRAISALKALGEPSASGVLLEAKEKTKSVFEKRLIQSAVDALLRRKE